MPDRSLTPGSVIIAADEDQVERPSLKFCLQMDGWDVQFCRGTEAVLDCPNLKRAACIIVDYRRAEPGAFHLRQSLLAKSCALPMILIAPPDAALRQRAAKAGFHAVLEEQPRMNDILLAHVYAAIAKA